MLLFEFLALAAGVTALVFAAGGGAFLGFVSFLLAFLLAHVLYLAVIALLCRGTDLTQDGAKRNRYAAICCKTVPELLCLYAGLRPVLTGVDKLPRGERFLFVCNHRSLFDPVMVMNYLADYEISFISKPSNLQLPLIGTIGRAAGFLAIDRENDRAALKTILQAADYMKRDICSIGIYPEGTRSRTLKLLPFHHGSFKTAQRAKVPLVIACVHGTEKMKQGFFLHPHKAYLEILEVIPAQQVAAMSTQELAEHSRERIQACLDRAEGQV